MESLGPSSLMPVGGSKDRLGEDGQEEGLP